MMTGKPATAGATLEAVMSKHAAKNRSELTELSEQQLNNVAGGTKSVDKASAKLFQACATGEHIKTATVAF
jgi:type VI protein secretion system component Hcp